jgi:hypothetical protein
VEELHDGSMDEMNGILASGLFVTVLVVLYFALLSRYGLFAHRVRKWQARHEQLDRDARAFSEAKDARSPAMREHTSGPGVDERKP